MKNIAASVRYRLLDLSRELDESFQLVLTWYCAERLLYRLGKSQYRDKFVLKGAMLYMLWIDRPPRPTRDVDFLGFGESSLQEMSGIFRELCELPVEDDGLILKADSIKVSEIRVSSVYVGIRVKLMGNLAGAKIPLQVDIGFGDVITPEAKLADYPTLLDQKAPRVIVYPRETTISEKYLALVNFGLENGRLKDYFDFWYMPKHFEFEGAILSTAIRNTFARQKTPLPTQVPPGLSFDYYENPRTLELWHFYLDKTNPFIKPPSLAEICNFAEQFFLPPTLAIVNEQEFTANWKPGGPWQ